MRRTMFFLIAAAVAVGCSDYTGPNPGTDVYALARVGTVRLPVFLGGNQTFPLLVADTLQLKRTGTNRNAPFLVHVGVLRVAPTQDARTETQHFFSLENGTLRYDQCPMGYFCAAASFIATPQTFQVVGDSLFQIQLIGNGQPYVYGRVRR